VVEKERMRDVLPIHFNIRTLMILIAVVAIVLASCLFIPQWWQDSQSMTLTG
jgi:hypothetical protein